MNVANRKIITDFQNALPTYFDRLDQATVEGQVPGFTGLLHIDTASADSVTVDVPFWFGDVEGYLIQFQTAPYDPTRPFPFATDTEENLLFSAGRSSLPFVVPVGATNPIKVSLPRSLFADGVQIVRYSVTEPTPLGNSSFSVPGLVIKDGVPPYGTNIPPAPISPVPASGPLDRNYFASQPGGKALFTIAYDLPQGRQEGDYVETSMGDLDAPMPIDSSSPETKHPLDNDPAVPPSFPLSLDNVLRVADGNYRLRYRVCDAAGYCSQWSNANRLTNLAEGPAPTNLLAPLVEHAVPGDRVINRAEVRLEAGLKLWIPQYTDFQRSTPSDTFRVTLTSSFGTVTLPDVPLGNTNFNVPITATEAQLNTLFGNSTGQVSVTASYEVIRGAATHPAAATTLFSLDLFATGPTPIDGTDVNPGLLPCVVTAVRGTNPTVYGTDNVLERVDRNRDAVGRVPLWLVPVTPANAMPFLVTFNYGGYTPPPLLVSTPADIPASGFWDFPIPANIVNALGSPQQLASYTISSPSSTNQQRPPQNTTVSVLSVFDRLDAPIVRSATTTVNCVSFNPVNTGVLTIFIPPNPLLTSVATILLSIEGFRNNTQTPPSSASFSNSYPVPVNGATLGFEVTFNTPDAFLQQIHNNRTATAGSLQIIYSAQLASGLVTSDPGNYRTNGIRPGSIIAPRYCAGGAVPP